jgi:phage-related protein
MSEHVEKISHKLAEFTTTLEEVQRKDKSLKGRILRWISKVFKVLSSVFALGAGVAGCFEPITATVLGLGSAISSAASSIASKMSERG